MVMWMESRPGIPRAKTYGVDPPRFFIGIMVEMAWQGFEERRKVG
jgi:hypothetical protein